MFNWMYETTPVSLYAAGGVDYYDGTPGGDGAPKAKFELPDNVMCIYEYKLPTGTMRAELGKLTDKAFDPVRQNFDSIDTDKDGQASYAEYEAFVAGASSKAAVASSKQRPKDPTRRRQWASR